MAATTSKVFIDVFTGVYAVALVGFIVWIGLFIVIFEVFD